MTTALPSLGALPDRAPIRRRGLLPVSLFLQGLDDLARHVVLVMLGQHRVGDEGAAGIDMAFGDHPLAFAEQVRHDTLVADRNVLAAVGNLETHLQIVAARRAPGLDHAAEPNAAAGRGLVLRT